MPRHTSRASPTCTAEHIAQALRRMHTAGWPADPQGCMAHPIYGPCVRGLARALARVAARTPISPKPAPPITSHASHGIDWKRLAANDRED